MKAPAGLFCVSKVLVSVLLGRNRVRGIDRGGGVLLKKMECINDEPPSERALENVSQQ